jgi:phage terminase large subunit
MSTILTNDLLVSPSIFYPTYESTMRRIIHQGGQWSGKTTNILISEACHAVYNTSKKLGMGDEMITVTAESLPHLKGGAIRDFDRFVYPYFRQFIKQYNKSDFIITFKSGAVMEFKSFKDEYSARGAKRTRLFVNEGNHFDYMTFFQLDSRTEIQTIIDYNPTAKFWVHDHLIGEKGNELLISDHRHNPFLSPEKHAEIEGIKDPELWKVYARGKTGNVIGTIFPNWKMVDEFPNEDGVFWGLDFGYTNDPTALVKCIKIGESIFLHECCYTAALTPTQLLSILKANGYNDEQTVYCEHDPDVISQLRGLEINAIRARKGPGSVNAGILKLKEYNVFYTYTSTWMKEELKRYVWEVDKNTGKPTNAPVDAWNHLMDAARMAVYTKYHRGE